MSTLHPTRREFLKSTSLAGASIALGEFALRPLWAAATAPDLPAALSWVDKPMRWAQLAFVDDDPLKIDAPFWFDYFARNHVDGVCLTAGGCTAFYPTDIPFHHRSPFLGGRDLFGEFVTGCRKLGMVVVARTDPHATYDDAKVAHPDWIAVTADGQPRRHWASPDMWVTCAFGPYNFDFMTAVKREIMSRYRVDAIFINRWEGSGLCYCEHCRENFRQAAGHDLPRGDATLQDPVRRAYFFWQQQRLFDLWRHWDAAVRAINPDSCVVPNASGGATGSLDMARIGELAPMIAADRQARHGPVPLWFAGRSAKEFRSVMGTKPVIGISGVGLEAPYRWKDSVQSPAEMRLWMIDALAHGARPWFVKFAGHLEDPRWLEPIAEFYSWCHGAERYLRNTRSLARVGLVFSQPSLWFSGNRERVEDASLGWYQALVEARVPFELVHAGLLDADRPAPFKTLILPNLVALSDAQCEQLGRFVARGGSLVATSATSLADESGASRKDFGLAGVFGVRFVRELSGPIRNAYIRLEHDRTPRHPLLHGLEDAPRTIAGTWRIEVEPTRPFSAPPLTLIPSYPDLPMEKVYAREPRTDIAQVFLRELPAGGRVAYFPWDIDRTFWEVLDPDHGRLMANTIAWANNEPAPVSIRGPGVLDVAFWQQPNSVTLHLVNLTNPMLMHGPIREFFPVGEQHLQVRLPDGLRARSARLLVANIPAAFHQAGDRVELTVPSVESHEIVAIDV